MSRSPPAPPPIPPPTPRALPLQVCDSLNDILRPAAYQAVPLLVSILGHSGSEGAKQASGAAEGPGGRGGTGIPMQVAQQRHRIHG